MNRIGILAVLVLASGCAVPSPSTARQVDRNLSEFQDEDEIVLRLVLQDLPRDEKFRTYPSWKSRPELVVWDTTEGLSAFITTGQLSSELRDQPPVSVELYNNLKSRNSRKITLKAVDLKEVRMGQAKDLPRGEDFQEAFERKFPRAKAYVSFWLPAYSEDATTALIRFAFGPTVHGAAGTYCLEKTNGSWKILWRHLAYFG